ncbi:MAG: FAD-binding domain-containing protein [Rhodospirillales bacterium]
MNLVWFKRDLRTVDHAALSMAAESGRVTALYVVEPEYWALPDTSARQWKFISETLSDLSWELEELGLSLTVRVGDVVDVLTALHANHHLKSLHSHQETGNLWTFKRDCRVKKWAKENNVPWIEHRQFGVIRRLNNRNGWAQKWDALIRAPMIMMPNNVRPGPILESNPIPTVKGLGMKDGHCPGRQIGGRVAGQRTLEEFLATRGHAYHKSMSSPNTAFVGCSRLSPYLAVGALSLREIAQATWQRMAQVRDQPKAEIGTWGLALKAFFARLHWHCHFMQKLEDAPRFEYSNVHPGYDGMRNEDDVDSIRLQAWADGQTGFPFVDACMRALNQTGWINFRMRAMLTAFASYHLWIHWRPTGLHLARQFTDYEPGIHWNQIQMQSGTTGINTVRIYNPVKQGYDHDPEGTFIRTWVPELKNVETAFIHEPWKMYPIDQKTAGCVLGKDYPEPIIDHIEAAQAARKTVYGCRSGSAFRDEASRIQAKHGSRKSGLPATPRRRKKATSDPAQFALDL